MTNPPIPADENLPEVVPDSSPQVLSNRDAFLAHDHLAEKDPKYIADSAPRPEDRDLKFAVDGQEGAESPSLVKGDDGVWRPAPVSALSPTVAATSPNPTSAAPESAAEEGRAEPGGEPVREEKVCGMRKRTFWIVLVVAIVIVLAAIGGGVGGGLSARNSSSSADDDSDENFLNNGTVPDRGFAFQAFSEKKYQGKATDIYTSEGFEDLPFTSLSYVWIPNDSGCCISFCQSKENTSQYWCNERFQPQTSGKGFPRLGVLCGIKFNRDSDEQRCEEEEAR